MEELAEQIRELFEEGDTESIKYILGGETSESVERFCSQLPLEMGEALRRLYAGLPREEEEDAEEEEGERRRRRIDEFLEFEEQEERNESFLELMAKVNEKLVYEEHFGFPFFDLVKRVQLTHGDPRPQPPAIKAVHSQLQILYGVLFSAEVLKALGEDCPNLTNGFRDYLCALFPQLTEKYFQFRQVYRHLKKEAVQQPEEASEEEGEAARAGNEGGVHEDATLELDEKEFLLRVSDSAEEFELFEKNRSYNFLCFGLRKYQAYIGLGPAVFGQLREREFCELLSFLSVRFIRRIVFSINRERNAGALLPLQEPITQQEVRRVGNEMVDDIAAQVQRFLHPAVLERLDEQAEAVFLEEFEPHHYAEFVPRSALRAALHEETLAQYVWRTCKEYKHIWRERVRVDYFLRHGGQRPQGEFLAEAEKNRLLYEANAGKVWKDYLMVKFGFTGRLLERAKGQGRKRSKLDSCSD